MKYVRNGTITLLVPLVGVVIVLVAHARIGW